MASTPDKPTNSYESWRSRDALIGAIAGILLGQVDVWLLWWLGVEHTRDGADATWLIALFFGFNFAMLGHTIGRLRYSQRAQRAQAQLLLTQAQALSDERAKGAQLEHLASLGRLAASVAHEVRNPLGVMRTSASLIMEDSPPLSHAAKAAEFIDEQAVRLDKFVRALLGYAKALPVSLAPSSSHRILDSLERMCLPYELAVERGDDEQLFTDEALVTQALHELVLNAAAFTPHDEHDRPSAPISCRVIHDAERVGFEIEDAGPGVCDKDAPHIFDPFFTTRHTGSGLGLAMSRRIARRLGGELVLETLAPDGARFRLWLAKVAPSED